MKKRNRPSMTLVANGSHFQGDFNIKGQLHLDGSLQGTLSCEQQISVGPEGELKGEAECESAVIGGLVEGQLHVRGTLHILSTGRIQGEIYYGQLHIEEGGTISGTVQAGSPSPKQKSETRVSLTPKIIGQA